MEEKDYINFVLDTLKNYKKYSDRLISDSKEIFPQDVQYVLANYQHVKFGLLSEVHRKLNEVRTLKRSYDSWWNSKVSEARKELLSTMPAGKFPALKEYSIKAQEDNFDEYNSWQSKIQDAEDRYDFMKALKEDWNSFQFILNMLNSNMTSELQSLRMDRDFSTRPVRVPRQ